MFEKLKAFLREEKILKACGCVCYCPSCKEPLNDTSQWAGDKEGLGTFTCTACRFNSTWHFGIAPVPICLSEPGSEEPVRRCPHCHKPFEQFLALQIVSWWRQLLGKPFHAIICRSCKEIVGYE